MAFTEHCPASQQPGLQRSKEISAAMEYLQSKYLILDQIPDKSQPWTNQTSPALTDYEANTLSMAVRLSNLKHENLLEFLGVHYVESKRPVLYFEKLQGPSLADVFASKKKKWTYRDVVKIGAQMADLAEVCTAQGIWISNFSPSNIHFTDNSLKHPKFGMMEERCEAATEWTGRFVSMPDRRVPVWRFAPEGFLSGQFRKESVVWQFGLLLWELCNCGRRPYETCQTVAQIQIAVSRALPQPQDFIPHELYEVMCGTWKLKPEDRLGFDAIRDRLEAFEEAPWLDVLVPDEPNSYSSAPNLSVSCHPLAKPNRHKSNSF